MSIKTFYFSDNSQFKGGAGVYYSRKIRWKVNEQTAAVLDEQSKILNWLCNKLLERANELRQVYRATQDKLVGRTLYSKWGLRNLVPSMKTEFPFLRQVYSVPLKQVAIRLSRAIRSYQDSQHGRRKGKKVKWPKPRNWTKHWFSIEYEDRWGYHRDGRLLTVHLGTNARGQRVIVKGKLAESLKLRKTERVKELRITKEAGEFYAIFTIERDAPKIKHGASLRVIALDPNHKNLAYGIGTDGQAIEIENLSTLKRLDERIGELQSRFDRCNRKSILVEYFREDGSVHKHFQASRRSRYFKRRLDQAYQKRRDETRRFLYVLANRLCQKYDVIGIGDYAPHGEGMGRAMRRAMFNQSLIDRFKAVLEWVCHRSGKTFVGYSEEGTTRTCHSCGYVVNEGIPPEVREWDCPNCKLHHLRDENAAQNGLTRVLNKLSLPRSGHTPVLITARWTWQVTPSGALALRGGEAVQSTT